MRDDLGTVGEEVTARVFSGEDRQRYRQKVRACLDVFARLLAEARFDSERRSFGLEIELNLTDEAGDPAMVNAAALEAIADPDFQTELGQFNVEINLEPRLLGGDGHVRARDVGAREPQHRGGPREHRGRAHDADRDPADGHRGAPDGRLVQRQPALRAAQRADLRRPRRGHRDLDLRASSGSQTFADTIAPEAACTSVQLHQLCDPEAFPAYWNAAQAIAALQVAIGANSPFFFGRELWAETRIALFEQATDTRPDELKAQGVRPRVWFGERWITSIFDLFEENARYFPALLPVTDDEDPLETLEAGGVPKLAELRLHNGTIYRWNRPIYEVVDGSPHLRVENRVLPAGPTVVDTLANAAFYYGLIRMLAEDERPIWSRMSFSAAEENFHLAAREGIEANVYWPGVGEAPAAELVLRRLLPLAHEGLDRWGLDPGDRDRLLGIVERRCATLRNGAAWQSATYHALRDDGLERAEALRRMTVLYRDHMHSNEPVHDWPVR